MFASLLCAFSISVDVTGQIDGCTQENTIILVNEFQSGTRYVQTELMTKTITQDNFVCIAGSVVITADSPFSAKYKFYDTSDKKFLDEELTATSPFTIKGDNTRYPLIKLYTDTPGKEIKIQFIKVGAGYTFPGNINNLYSVFTTTTDWERVFKFKYILNYGIEINSLILTAVSKYKLKIITDSDNFDAEPRITPYSSDGVGNVLGLHFTQRDEYDQNPKVTTNFLITIKKNETTVSEGVDIMFDEDLFLLLPDEKGHFTREQCSDYTKQEMDNVFQKDPCIVNKYKYECYKVPTPPAEIEEDDGLSGGAIAGIVIGVIAAVVIIAVLIWFFVIRKKSSSSDQPEP